MVMMMMMIVTMMMTTMMVIVMMIMVMMMKVTLGLLSTSLPVFRSREAPSRKRPCT